MSTEKNLARVRPGTTDGTLNKDGSKKQIGGRFAIKVNRSANVALNKKQWADDNPEGGFKDAALLNVTMKIVREYANRLSLSTEDTQDVAQEVLLSVLETQSRKVREQTEAGVEDAAWAISGGYIRTVAKAFTGRRMDAHKRHEDSKALKMLADDIERIEAAEGRHLEKSEKTELKHDILANWHDPRHKPNVNFDEPPVLVSADAMGTAFAQSQAGVEDSVIEGASAAHRLVDEVEEKAIDKDAARLQVWNSLVEETGAPQAHKGLLNATSAAAAKSAIGGNIRKVAEKVLNGAARPSELTHFFAPFGALTKTQGFAVAETVYSRPTMGALMWEAAVDYANADYAGPEKTVAAPRKRVAAKP